MIRIVDLLARAREWVSSAHRRFGFSTSQPSLPAPSSDSSSHAMQPSSVVWIRFDDMSVAWCVMLLAFHEKGKELLDRNWSVSIIQQANTCADYLANLGVVLDTMNFSEPPADVRERL